MDISRSPSSIYYRGARVTPRKSPLSDNVQRRRRDLEKSEKAAFWAVVNTSIAVVLYYDLCYLNLVDRLSSVLVYGEWLACFLFLVCAFYDYAIHFWAFTLMKPIVVSPFEKQQWGIGDDEPGFKLEETSPTKIEPIQEVVPKFEIHHSFEEDERIVTPPKKQHTSDSSLNTSNRRRVEDKESLAEYLSNCSIFEDDMADFRRSDLSFNRSYHRSSP